MATEEELRDEERRMQLLRIIVDLTALVLVRGRISRAEALNLVRATRKKVLQLFPDKEEVYDLIYKPRFERLLREFVRREILTPSKN